MDTTLNAQEELAFIRKVMADSRTASVEDGKPYIIWGIIVGLGMLGTYIEALGYTYVNAGWLWIILSAIGVGYVFWFKIRTSSRKVETLADRLIGAIWGATGITLAVMIVSTNIAAANMQETIIHPLALCPICAAIIGIAYFMSGVLYGLPWVRNLALVWWAGAIGMMFWQSVHILLVYSLMMIIFQVIPGIILYRNYRKTVN
jgi:hypothetical protein